MIARFLPLAVGAFLACSVAGAEKAKPKTKPAPKPVTEEQVRQTLERIVIPTLSFREASFREAIDFLRKETRRLDPKKRGVPFHVRVEPPPPARGPIPSPSPSIPGALPPPAVPEDPEKVMITVSLTEIPLIGALKYVT